MLSTKRNIPLLFMTTFHFIVLPAIKETKIPGLLLPPAQLFEIVGDVKKLANEYLKFLFKKTSSLKDIQNDTAKEIEHIKKENLILQIVSTKPQPREIDPHYPLHIYLSKIGTPKVVAIDLGEISPTTENNRFKNPQTLLLDVIKNIESYLKVSTLKIPGFDKWKYGFISNFKKYDTLALDSKFPFKIINGNREQHHYFDVSQVKTINIFMSKDGDLTINGHRVGYDNGTQIIPRNITPPHNKILIIAKQDTQHPEILDIASEDNSFGTTLNVTKTYPKTDLLQIFPSISEALAP